MSISSRIELAMLLRQELHLYFQDYAVFFPSLLFGWMRRATGSVTSAIIFHAICNLFVEIASRFYA